MALEAVKGLKSLTEIATAHKVVSSQVTIWKKALVEGSSLFEGTNRVFEEQEEHIAELERTLRRAILDKESLVKKVREGNRATRKAMVEANHPQLSIRRQCDLLGVNRNRLEPKRRIEWHPGPEHRKMMRLIKRAHAKDPTMGARQLREMIGLKGYHTSRWTVGKLMKQLGIKTIY